jgi:uracil-DNA glycosylase
VITIVGQAPGRWGDPRRPLGGRCGIRLARAAGLGSVAELRARARLVNLLGSYPGKSGKGDAFPMVEAIGAAQRMRPCGIVLLAGKAVGRAFGIDSEFFEWRRRGGTRYAVIPHPSGVSRWWNDPRNVEVATRFLRGVFGA